MAALTKDRNTKVRGSSPAEDAFPVAANAVIYAGAMVSANAAGYAKPSTDTAGETFLGLAEFGVDNTGGANGAKEIQVIHDCAALMELTGVTVANHGEQAFVSDDQTLATAGNVSVGRFANLESGKVWARLRQGGA